MRKEKLVIVGSGAAGLTAAIYAARANLKPLVVEGLEPGGQLTLTSDVENYPGFPEGIMGPELMEKFKQQAARFGAEFVFGELTKADLSKRPFQLKIGSEEVEAEALVVATGASARWLGIPSEKKFQGKGVSTCATCDGAFFRDMEIAVVGGGDSAMEEANFLTRFASKVYLIHRRDQFRASKIMLERAQKSPKIEFVMNHEVAEIRGETTVESLLLKNTQNGEEKEIAVKGLFLAIGHIPNTRVFEGQLGMDQLGYLESNGHTTETEIPGVFSAGDVHDTRYRQAITAAGSGCKAAMDAEKFLEEAAEA